MRDLLMIDTELDGEDLKSLVEKFKKIYFEELREEFPQDPMKQLELSIKAVFESWNNPRSKVYRRLNDIADNLGTAVNVQSMVFGNMGDTSGTGVAFTRNPATGENHLFGEYLINAQGEDVVAAKARGERAILVRQETSPEDIEGIGLCRTEHMFFEESRIASVRKMILATTLADRKSALDELLPVQR